MSQLANENAARDSRRATRASAQEISPATALPPVANASENDNEIVPPVVNVPVPEHVTSSSPANIPDIPASHEISEGTKAFLVQLIEASTRKLSEQLAASNAKVDVLTADVIDSRNQVKELSARLDRAKYEIRAMRIELDDLQQYGRRRSIRIEGLEYKNGETEDELFTKIKTSLAEVSVPIEKSDVIRFHRSSKPKVNRDKVLCAQTIVKFGRWAPRKQAHYANKRARTSGKSFRIHHDLTKRRYELLKKARSLIDVRFAALNKRPDGEAGENHRDQVLAFADINSNLLVRYGEDTFPFNKERDLEDIFDEISRA